ncbi:MAG: DUF2851 family protein [Candidatus Cloacimonetes bacterium]|jgi:hypothetical protein|nr:DUF2851 family protein [Candidatus Cloacimonadota bacterium]MCB5287986.1 DUF2851 family protein [Candidatus Cloacimonadota bacterium]MCK9185515.1 DUF2851 family protein [Candidatus Cloacimonadota bacterium]MDY0230308.1 DUF2851 family protein [Candidatus Cloacimonadaceae bacterium]
MEEKFLYHIWDEGHLRPGLLAESKLPIKIVYQGQFNTARGPDFKNAIIEIAGETKRGDIEIHLKTSDWQAHNHQEDAYYNQVILHVVLKHNSSYPYTILEDGSKAEILSLEKQLSEDIQKLLAQHDESAKPAVYCDLLSAIDSDHLEAILHTAGMRRFAGKLKRFNTALSLSSFDQIFYEGIFEALGYNKNKLNTLYLAQSLPLKTLAEYKAEGMSKLQLCAIYLCASRLLKRDSGMLDETMVAGLWREYEEQPWQGQKISIDWQLFRIRPQNHPLKRLIYISDLIWEHLDGDLLKSFITATESETKLHKAFGSMWIPRTPHPDLKMQTLGKSVQNNIYLNIFLPVMALWHQKMSSNADPIYQAYMDFRSLQENYVTRFMQRYLNPSQIKLANSRAIYQQGLMDIYHRFCNWHYCSECLNRAKD